MPVAERITTRHRPGGIRKAAVTRRGAREPYPTAAEVAALDAWESFEGASPVSTTGDAPSAFPLRAGASQSPHGIPPEALTRSTTPDGGEGLHARGKFFSLTF